MLPIVNIPLIALKSIRHLRVSAHHGIFESLRRVERDNDHCRQHGDNADDQKNLDQREARNRPIFSFVCP
jgi:hypothetical protein